MSTYAVDGDKLTAIADAIRLKRGITTDMTLDDMPLQIALIDGGGGGIEMQSGTFNVTTQGNSITVPTSTFPKLYLTDSVLMIFKRDLVAPNDNYYYIVNANIIFSDFTRELVKNGNYYESKGRAKGYISGGAEYTIGNNTGGSSFADIRGSTGAFSGGFNVTFNQTSSGWQFNSGNIQHRFVVGQYEWKWIYFGDNPEADIITF